MFEVRVRGLDDHRVRLISPESPGFDVLAGPLMHERVAPVGLQLKPMLAIVANDSPQTIVSVAIVWRITHAEGRTSRCWGHFSFPETVVGDALIRRGADAIWPGRHYLAANSLVIHGYGNVDPYYDQFLGQFVDEKNAMLADATTLDIEINAVIFADGTLIGPDDNGMLAELFSLCVREKQNWYRGIIEALDQGASVDEAFAALRVYQEEQARHDRQMPSYFSEPDRRHEIWRMQGAADAWSWRLKFSDDQIPALLKPAIRLEPFAVRRRA
jgi:hypothetical protein